MDITSLTNLYRSQQLTAKAPDNTVQKAISTATTRLEAQRSSTDVQLSAYGKTKAGFATLQTASKTLTNNAATPAQTKAALQDMVSAYNSVRSAAGTTQPGAASNSANALRRTMTGDAMRADLKALGVSQDKDGTMVLDTKAFDQALAANPIAVKEATSRMGTQVQATASRALSESGGLNRSLSALNTRSQHLDTWQAALQGLSANQESANNASTSAGIASYSKIFSM